MKKLLPILLVLCCSSLAMGASNVPRGDGSTVRQGDFNDTIDANTAEFASGIAANATAIGLKADQEDLGGAALLDAGVNIGDVVTVVGVCSDPQYLTSVECVAATETWGPGLRLEDFNVVLPDNNVILAPNVSEAVVAGEYSNGTLIMDTTNKIGYLQDSQGLHSWPTTDYVLNPGAPPTAESLWLPDDSTGTYTASFTPQSTGTIYYRVALKNLTTTIADGYPISLELLDDSDVNFTGVKIRASSGMFYRAYTTLGAVNNNVTITPTMLDDQLYYLEGVYQVGVSNTVTLLASDRTSLGTDVILDTTASAAASIQIIGSESLLLDMVEVRTDDSWGSATNQVFYSDFNTDIDDAQWGTLPAGWDDDYTTGALE